ncbi:anti-sigma factor [Haliscomenobacter sp.]|uniref:anti-sigma factor n=1 Tax=Haliscomenobacter sp. TaxID=2717303 RepID=UPI00336501A7
MEQFNIQEYLDSGVIEMYVLDQLNDAEREAVEKLATQYPEIQHEIAEVEEAMGSYHASEGLTPPDYILSNILAETARVAVSNPALAEQPVPSLPKQGKFQLWPIAATVVGLVLFVWIWISKKNADQYADQLQKELLALRSKEQACATNEQFLLQQFNLLRQDGIQRVTVKGGTEPIAAVYWNKGQRVAHFDLLNLKDPGQNQYQLWAIVKGQPVSLGVVNWQAARKGLVSYKLGQKPDAFAISLEPFGGSPTPTAVKGSGLVVPG